MDKSLLFLNAFIAYCAIRVGCLCIGTIQPIIQDIFKKPRSFTVMYHYFRLFFCNNKKRYFCKKKIRIRVANRVKRWRLVYSKRTWTVENDWEKVIFSDESQSVIGNDCRVTYGEGLMNPGC